MALVATEDNPHARVAAASRTNPRAPSDAARQDAAGGARIHVVIATQQVLLHEVLMSLLAERPDIAVGRMRIAGLPRGGNRDIALYDVERAGNPFAKVASFSARFDVIVLAASDSREEASLAIQCGARAVVPKRLGFEKLVEAIRTVARGQLWLPAAVQEHLVGQLRRQPAHLLTGREREIARSAALGMKNGEIARNLFISEVTVKSHLNNIFRKIGVRDRTELSLYATRTGLVTARERML